MPGTGILRVQLGASTPFKTLLKEAPSQLIREMDCHPKETKCFNFGGLEKSQKKTCQLTKKGQVTREGEAFQILCENLFFEGSSREIGDLEAGE